MSRCYLFFSGGCDATQLLILNLFFMCLCRCKVSSCYMMKSHQIRKSFSRMTQYFYVHYIYSQVISLRGVLSQCFLYIVMKHRSYYRQGLAVIFLLFRETYRNFSAIRNAWSWYDHWSSSSVLQ